MASSAYVSPKTLPLPSDLAIIGLVRRENHPTTLKDLSKAIQSYLTSPVLPLPDDLSDFIEGYLRRHQKYDENASDRLQEELSSIFSKQVKGNSAAAAPWLAVVRRLLPVLQTADRIFTWWNTSTGLLEKPNPEKDIVDESFAGMKDIIALAEEHADTSDTALSSNPLIGRLFSGWMNKLYPAACEGIVTSEYLERLTRESLVYFGKRHPKELFKVLDRYFLESKYRKAVLRFLGDYFQSQPPHLHQILDTSLFNHILMCLQYDTSNTIVSSALTSLIILLPHMPSSLAPHLPVLFNIYARLLFWSRERSGGSMNRSDGCSWQVCGPEPSEDLTVAHLQDYYTVLYGLYPLNFMDYIRKPQRYLRHANVANANDVEVQPTEIRDKSERFRKCHVLHPNFYTLTLESEKTDFGRWLKSEASEVAADCMSLCVMGGLMGDSAVSPLSVIEEDPVADHGYDEGYDTPILSRSVDYSSDHDGRLSRSASTESISSPLETATTRQGSLAFAPASRETLEIKKSESSADSPTLPAQLTQSSSYTQLQDMIQSNKAIKSTLNQSMANDSVPSLSLSQQGSVREKPPGSTVAPLPTINAPASLTEPGSKIAQLQRQVLILQNDLNFETYQKQQHMARIGDLRRKRMGEDVTESEMQNLMMTNRSLKNRFEEAKKSEMQVRRDSAKSRALAKKWEADLSNKMKTLRDESKKLNAEADKLKKELEESKAERQKLRELLCEAEVKELRWRQDARFAEMQEAEVQRLKGEVQELMIQLRDYQANEVTVQGAATAALRAKEELEILKLKLKSRDDEIRNLHKSYQAEFSELREKFTKTGKGKGKDGSLDPDQISMVREHLAASRAKQAELQKQLDIVSRKYRAIQSSFLDFKVAEAQAGGLSKSPISPGGSLLPNSFGSKSSTSDPIQRAPLPKSPAEKKPITISTSSRTRTAPLPIDVLQAGGQTLKDRSEATERARKSDEKKDPSFKGIRGYV